MVICKIWKKNSIQSRKHALRTAMQVANDNFALLEQWQEEWANNLPQNALNFLYITIKPPGIEQLGKTWVRVTWSHTPWRQTMEGVQTFCTNEESWGPLCVNADHRYMFCLMQKFPFMSHNFGRAITNLRS